MDPEFADLERHREDLLAAEEAERPPAAEPCGEFVPGGGENLLGEPTCASCGLAEGDH